MTKINSVSWGKVKIDGKSYHQVLIVDSQVLERDSDKLHQLFSTTHQIGDWEEKQLLSGNPQVILIANGVNGLLTISEEFKTQILKLRIELKVVLTPKAVREYNQLIEKGIRVNALIHTTC